MEDKKVIKNEKQEIHKISKELENRMICEEQCIMELEEFKRKKAEFDKKYQNKNRR